MSSEAFHKLLVDAAEDIRTLLLDHQPDEFPLTWPGYNGKKSTPCVLGTIFQPCVETGEVERAINHGVGSRRLR